MRLREQWWGECGVRCYRLYRTDSGVLILLTEGPGRLLPHTRVSHVVFVYSRSRRWQHVGGWRRWWLGSLQLAGHRGPESALSEMFAQLTHHLLRHIAEGCQQQNESMESMNDRCKTTANIFNMRLSWNMSTRVVLTSVLLSLQISYVATITTSS